MLEFDMDLQHGVLTVQPKGALTADDFEEITSAVDTYIGNGRDLAGLVIYAESFPGWASFAGMLSHFRFIKDHHKHIKRVAVVSDAAVLAELPALADHFVHAKLMHFPYSDYDGAVEWAMEAASEAKAETQ